MNSTQHDNNSGIGYLPYMMIVIATGVLLVSIAYSNARYGYKYGDILRWVGLVVIFAPACFRLLMQDVPHYERVGIVLFLGLAFYLVKVMYSPLSFKFADELQHWRTTDTILSSGRLLTTNRILPVSPYFPALQNITTAFSTLSGLSITQSGFVVIGMVRIVFVLGYYLVYERVTKSAHIASLGAMIYMLNPHYQFLNSMFTYQAIGLAIMSYAWFTYSRLFHSDGKHNGIRLSVIMALFAVTVSHHITSYMHVIMLLGWAIVTILWRRGGNQRRVPIILAVLAFLLSMNWTLHVATLTIDYLATPLQKIPQKIVELINGENHSTEEEDVEIKLPSGPRHEFFLSLGAVGWICLMTLLGAWYIWRHYRENTLALLLGLVGLGYFGSLGLRFAPEGAELTGRTWPFLFIGVAFVIAVGIVHVQAQFSRFRRMILVGSFGVLLLIYFGGIMSGWLPYWGRLPGPYRVGASELSVDFEGEEAAIWGRDYLPEDSRFAGSFEMHLLFGAYARQYSTFGLSTLFVSPRFGAREVDLLTYTKVRYIGLDDRWQQELPVRGFYFGSLEPPHVGTTPITPIMLGKFDTIPDVNRMMDSGHIKVYDMKGTINEAK